MPLSLIWVKNWVVLIGLSAGQCGPDNWYALFQSWLSSAISMGRTFLYFFFQKSHRLTVKLKKKKQFKVMERSRCPLCSLESYLQSELRQLLQMAEDGPMSSWSKRMNWTSSEPCWYNRLDEMKPLWSIKYSGKLIKLDFPNDLYFYPEQTCHKKNFSQQSQAKKKNKNMQKNVNY